MTVTENLRSALETWLDEHWVGQATCPAGHDAWSVAPTMSFMPGFVVGDAGPKIAHERGFTFVVLTCTECAYVALLDTKTIGVSLAG
jgi:hypothetical protein